MLPKLMSVREAAIVLGVSSKTLYHWCQHGAVHSVKIGGRVMLVRELVDNLARGEAA